MRYGIFSDVHANLPALEAVLKAYRDEGIDRYLCVGDIVGYAAEPQACIRIVKELCSGVVAGNHDWAVADLFSLEYFNSEAKKAVIWTRDKLNLDEQYYLGSLRLIYRNADLVLVHSSLDKPEYFGYITDLESARECFRYLESHICFIGHLHISGVFVEDKNERIYYYQPTYIKLEEENRYIINVGSVGQPRDGNPMAIYCIFDAEKKEVWIRRVDYDIKSTYNKIIKAGLPYFLAERLFIGR